MNRFQQSLFLIGLLFSLTGKSAGQWLKINGPYGRTGVSCFTIYQNNLYAGSENLGVFLSTDLGVIWKSLNDDLPAKSAASLLRIDTILFAGTYKGLYRSTDNGLHWNVVKGGIPINKLVCALFVQDSILLAGTNYGMIFRSIDNGKTGLQPMPAVTGDSQDVLHRSGERFLLELMMRLCWFQWIMENRG